MLNVFGLPVVDFNRPRDSKTYLNAYGYWLGPVKLTYYCSPDIAIYISLTGPGKTHLLLQCLTSGGGPLQKFSKTRFFKNYDTFTLIPLRQKTQHTKVVSSLKGFGDPTQTL